MFRHEYKYIIADTDIIILERRLKSLAKLDSHIEIGNSYKISSLYFDNYRNDGYRDNENGVDPREKYRIRIYNGDTGHIALECKRKERGKTLKESCVISEELCSSLMGEKREHSITEMPALARSLRLKELHEKMRPVVIVEYERVPFVYKTGNVRITIDKQLCSSKETKKFLSGGYSRRPIMQSGYSILEVKWDGLIPDYLFQACQMDGLVQTNCSKYYLSRKYHM